MIGYLLAFHLTAPRDEYRYLDFALTAKHANAFTDSVLLVTSEETASEIADDLLRVLKPGDRVLVTRCETSGPGYAVREVGKVDS